MASTLTSAQRDQLISLFVTMFDAAPGAAILKSLVEVREAGSSPVEIAEILASKAAFKQIYPAALSAEEVAARIVSNLLTDSTPLAAKDWSKAWITSQLLSGQSVGAVMAQASEALTLTTNSNFRSAQEQLKNKVAVAHYYSVALEGSSTSITEMQALLSDVTDDPATVVAARAVLGEVTSPTGGTGTPPSVEGTSETLSATISLGGETVRTLADKVTLQLRAGQPPIGSHNGIAEYATVHLDTSARELNITLTPSVDNAGTATSVDDVYDKLSLSINTKLAPFSNLSSLRLSGNGKADIINGERAALVYIDASGLSSKTSDGVIDLGLSLASSNQRAETIRLGNGKDSVTLTASTVGATDTITGLNLVENSMLPNTVDRAVSDILRVSANGFVKTDINTTGINFALLAAARSSAGDQLVFHQGGNTYIYADSGTTRNSLDDADLLVKLVGIIDLDLLIDVLNG